MVVGGYDDDLKKSVEYFIDGAWEDHPAELEFGRWAYGMPNYIPQDMVRKGGGYFSKCSDYINTARFSAGFNAK